MQYKDCGTGNFFFRFIDDLWGQSPGKQAFHRICTAMRMMGVKTVAIENLDMAEGEKQRFQQEEAALRLRLEDECEDVQATKVTFLRIKTSSETAQETLAKNTDNENTAFLGYAIIVKVTLKQGTWCYVFECVTREISSLQQNQAWQPIPYHYLHVQRTFQCQVGNISYRLRGNYFRQQNSITNVCAHACALMMLNNVEHYTQGLITAEDINEFLKINHQTKRLLIDKQCRVRYRGNRRKDLTGLTTAQLKKFFESRSFDVFLLKFRKHILRKKFRAFLYGFVESQFPAMLAFDTNFIKLEDDKESDPGHVVAVVGHTLSPNSWLPASGAYTSPSWLKKHGSSLAWVDSLLIHDDNFGTQYTLPAHAFKPERDPDQEKNYKPREALGIFPVSLNVRMLGNDAEGIAGSVIRRLVEDTQGKILTGNYYTERLMVLNGDNGKSNFMLRRSVVFRPILVRWRDYLNCFWKGRSMPKKTEQFINWVEQSVSSHVWIVEITEPNLFVGNKAKVLEVVLNPRQNLAPIISDENDNWTIQDGTVLMVRRPQGVIIPREGTDLKDWDDLPGWEMPGYMPLFSHNKNPT